MRWVRRRDRRGRVIAVVSAAGRMHICRKTRRRTELGADRSLYTANRVC